MKVLRYLSASILALVSAFVAIGALENRIKLFNIFSSDDKKQFLTLPKWLKILIAVFIGVGGFFSTIMLYENCSLTANIIRLQIGYVSMSGAACFDLREHRIPNIFPAAMALAGIVCLSVMYFSNSDGVIAYIVSSLVGAVLCAVSMLIVYALTKGGIGIGDIKLFSSLALLCGANALGGTVAVGAVACGLTTIVLLLSKKKTKKDALPFAPFAFLGFLISVLLPIA